MKCLLSATAVCEYTTLADEADFFVSKLPGQKQALLDGDFDTFLAYVKESGKSSWCCLQNVMPAGRKEHQEVAIALALAEELLAGSGACRVHGGGFAGTIQAFVPVDKLDAFKAGMEAVLGAGQCHVLSITPNGGMLESETEVQA